jgi:hypothetical protein
MRTVLVVGAVLGLVGCGSQRGDAELGTSQEELRGQFCGGIAGIACPTGYTCVDDKTDSCDPAAGGADCGGICVRERACKPDKKYVSRNTTTCASILFLCESGREPFFNESGCGCACEGSTVDKCADPSREYVSHDPYECQLIRYSCVSGVGFSDECGCGCIN